MSIAFDTSLSFAQKMDQEDPLRKFRRAFHFPQHNGEDSLYFCGNSLGIQPKGARAAIEKEMDRWQNLGVEGHFQGDLTWMDYHKALHPASAHVVGAKEEEVIIMNTLTVNIHLMMVSFYRPTSKRYKIIMEAGAFPSDQYVAETQVKFHGFDPEEAIIEVSPRPGELILHQEDIEKAIRIHGAETALIMFGGLNYYTGQLFDMEAITKIGHEVGALVAFDLAHAAGNVPLKMHDWGVDFATWCTYKYLNAGPGSLGGCFIHERHLDNPQIPRFAGWWGHDEARRFDMEKGFIPAKGAAGWQLSNNPILALPAMKVSHDLHLEAGMPALRQKSLLLTAYLEFLIDGLEADFDFITPRDKEARGAQLSFFTGPEGKALFNYISDNGVICDWRAHNLPQRDGSVQQSGVIRIAPAPIYNSFTDVWKLVQLLATYEQA